MSVTSIIQSIPSQAWMVLAAAIVSSIIAFLGVLLSNIGNNKRLKIQLEHEQKVKQEEQTRERIETLYLLSERNHREDVKLFVKMYVDMDKTLKISFEEDKNKVYEFCDADKICMLVNLYFHELKIDLDKITELRDTAHSIWADCMAQKRKPTNEESETFMRITREEHENTYRKFITKVLELGIKYK